MSEVFDIDLARHQDREMTEDQRREEKIQSALNDFSEKVRGIYEGKLIDDIFCETMNYADLDSFDHYDVALKFVSEKQRQIWENEFI